MHYNEKYGSAAKAIKSGDADALSVIGIFFNAVKGADPNPALARFTFNNNCGKIGFESNFIL